ncbi:MAG: hypothetical protein EOO28_10705 [Comamonadaceae bacterium]|nr:MAG: hypothetical protein EOO28_10705 [Comamonadaceae bacterium]
MNENRKQAALLATIVAGLAASLLIAAPAFAKPDHDKDGKHGKDKHYKAQKHGGKHDRPVVQQLPVGGYFQEPQRGYVREYYTSQYNTGRCPPGLAKKNKGCMPPGQAKKWREGQPLRTTYYTVPQPLVQRLGPPPAGHRYVRVDSDILLVTIGTMMVVDGISGLIN